MTSACRSLLVAATIAACGLPLGCTDTGMVGTVSGCAEDCGDTRVCHPSLAVCVECATDADCASHAAGETPRALCESASHACVECRVANDCPVQGSGCASGRCMAPAAGMAGQAGEGDDEANHGVPDPGMGMDDHANDPQGNSGPGGPSGGAGRGEDRRNGAAGDDRHF